MGEIFPDSIETPVLNDRQTIDIFLQIIDSEIHCDDVQNCCNISTNSNSNTKFKGYFHDVNSVLLNVEGDERFFIKFKILGLELMGLLDSGSQVSIVGTEFGNVTQFFNVQPLDKPIKLSSASGDSLSIQGYVDIPFTWNNVTKILPCLLVPQLQEKYLFGVDFFKLFDVKLTVDNNCDNLQVLTVDSANDIFQSQNNNYSFDININHELSSSQSAEIEDVKSTLCMFCTRNLRHL